MAATATTWVAWAGLVVLGWIAGTAAVARPAGACSCTDPGWSLQLEVEALESAGDEHRQFWPEHARLTSYPGTAYIWAQQTVAGVVARAGVGP